MEFERTSPQQVREDFETHGRTPLLPSFALLGLLDRNGLAQARRAAEAEIYGPNGEDPRFPTPGRLPVFDRRTKIPPGFRPR